jgi:hypothetical protein
VNASDIAASQPASAAAAELVPASTAASAIPFLRHDTALESTGMGVGNALVTVLVLAAVGLWFAHRLGWLRRNRGGVALQRLFGTSGNSLRVLESTRLTPKASAHVLQWGGKQVLVVCTDHSATLVAESPASAQPPAEGAR